ncbi:unnamed protein product [Chondrus crispus]|uniref:Uncharacterized protein n=1 Tax=Chondrus crispus TaxID=2769 RepID=R7QTG7_CHOCR|nr:unnamed protein product [Chondrus crispus]CDF41414.1 unnamed protein product [Chondrus crispus]|eukprot:XP_005711708.1 unnamed protein product [Chondrus crispus]
MSRDADRHFLWLTKAKVARRKPRNSPPQPSYSPNHASRPTSHGDGQLYYYHDREGDASPAMR